jgi:ABC-2 type transport system permease protein
MMPNYIKIEILRMLRNKRYIIFVVGFPVAFYLLYSSLWGDEAGSGGVRGSLILMVSMAAYGALAASMMSTSVPWAQERQSGWLRQLQITPLPSWSIIVTKLITSLLLVLPSLVLVCLAAVLTQGVSLRAWQWAALLPIMWIGTIPFAALGLIIGSLLSADSAQPVAMICMLGLSFIGGLLIPVEVMSATVKSIAQVTPSFSYADMGWHLVAGTAPPLRDVATILIWAAVLGTVAVFAYRRATVRA